MIDSFGLPLSSIVLFVLAGVLIGYLLWYHDRSTDTKKMNGLENRYFKARGSARQRKQRFLKLQKNSENHLTELELLRQKHDALLNRTNDLQQSTQQSHAELQDLRIAKQETDETLEAEQKRSESVVTQLQEVLQTKTALERDFHGQTETLAQLQTSHQELESEIEQLRGSLSARTKSAADSQQTVDELSSANKLQSETIDQLRQGKEQLESSLADSTESLTQTQQDLVSRCADLDAMRADHDALDQEHQQTRFREANLVAQLGLANVTPSERDQFAVDLESAAKSLAEQRQLLDSRELDLAKLHAEVRQLRQELSGTSEQLNQYQSDNQTLTESVAEKESRIDELLCQIEELLPLRAEIANTNLELVEQKTETQQRDELIEQQRIELDSLLEKLLTMESVKSELSTVTSQLASVTSEFDSVKNELTSVASELNESNDQCQTLRTQLDQVRGELVAAGETIDKHRERSSSLEDQCAEQAAEIELLTEESTKIPVLQQQVQQSQTELTGLREDNELRQSTIHELSTEIEQLRVRLAEFESTKEELESISKELVTVSNERDELSTARAGLVKTVILLRNQFASQSAKVKEVNELLAVKSQAASALHKQVQSQTTAVGDLTLKLEQQQQTVEKLTVALSQAESFRPKHEALQKQVADLMTHLKRLNAELEDSLDANAKAQDRVRDLEYQVHDHAIKIRDLRRERGSIAGIHDDQRDNSGRRAA